MEFKGFSQIPMRFSLFLDYKNPKVRKWEIRQFFLSFQQQFEPNFESFFLLSGILLLKIGFCFYYFTLEINELSIKQYVDLIIIIFLYIYTTFNLNRILGNNDLIRKYSFLTRLNEIVYFQNSMIQIGLKKKLDITCSISLEAWDNARKRVLTHENDWLATLELSYFCLLVYFIFNTLVCLSSYFEFYWIFSEDSILLISIIVIMSTFNFMFLSTFFLIRFYQGNKFNDVFEELDNNLTYLIDIMKDLQTMFDSYFNKQKDQNLYCESTSQISEFDKQKSKDINEIEKQLSIHGLVVKKFKLLSKFYIKNGVKYEDKIYAHKYKSKLRKNLIMNAKLSLEKVKDFLINDQKLHKYQFLNAFEVNFKEILLTLLFALATTLPTIIPKFIKLFTQQNSS